jgi:hypothetical protein
MAVAIPTVERTKTVEYGEFVMVPKAAHWLDISPLTLQNWISRKRFTAADGLRRFGGSTRIHFPTLKARALAGELLTPAAPC